MADDFNITLEHLRALRADAAEAKQERGRILDELRSINEHMGAFFRSITHLDGDVADLKTRVERIEKQLGLVQHPEH